MAKQTLFALLLLLAPLQAVAEDKAPLRVLFYGNSFTHGYGSTRSVDQLFVDVAVAAGHKKPVAVSAAVSSRDIRWHVKNNTPVIASLSKGEWSYVVMQEHSTKLTRAYPDTPAFPASIEESQETVLRLVGAVKRHSPSVTPVLYETWARGPGHEWFEGAEPLFSNPAEMQAEVRSGYQALKRALVSEGGSEVVLIAPVGDAWEQAGYEALHAPDNWHAQNRGTLLAALVIYGTIYEDLNTHSIDLSQVLVSLELEPEDGEFLTGVADETLQLASRGDLTATHSGR